MVRIDCLAHHPPGPHPCDECAGLIDYAMRRLEVCPFKGEKPACNHCQVHCYSAAMRGRVKSVMCYAGPACCYAIPGWH